MQISCTSSRSAGEILNCCELVDQPTMHLFCCYQKQRDKNQINSLWDMSVEFLSAFIHLHYIYAFSRRFYPKRLTLHSSYTFTFDQLLLSLGIEPMILALLAPCSTIWATGKFICECVVERVMQSKRDWFKGTFPLKKQNAVNIRSYETMCSNFKDVVRLDVVLRFLSGVRPA